MPPGSDSTPLPPFITCARKAELLAGILTLARFPASPPISETALKTKAGQRAIVGRWDSGFERYRFALISPRFGQNAPFPAISAIRLWQGKTAFTFGEQLTGDEATCFVLRRFRRDITAYLRSINAPHER